MTCQHRRYYYVIILSALVGILSSCHSEHKNDPIHDSQSKRKIVTKDSTIQEQIKGLEMAVRDELEFRMGLTPLEKGFNGLQLRLHKTHDVGTNEQFVVITDSNSHRSAKVVEFHQIYSMGGDSVGLVITKLTNKAPHSSWKKLIDSLISLNILALPDFESIPNYQIPSDGGQINIEWAKGDKYGRYSYYSPDVNASNIAEARKIVGIANLIEDEFELMNFGYYGKKND
jgi:hypothetical protein